MSKKAEGFSLRFVLINTGNISRKVLSKVLRSFDKNFERLHDRFLIIDEETAYHIGASIKDAGKKCFGISRIEDVGIISDVLQRLEIETEEAND